MSYIIQHSSILAIIRIWHCWPIELEQMSSISVIDISIIYSFDTLELKSQKMFQSYLRMRMAETIRCPSYLRLHSKLSIHKVMAYGVLIQDIIEVTDCLIILYPPSVRQFKLPIFNQFLHLFSLSLGYILIPIFEKNNLCYKIFSCWFFS